MTIREQCEGLSWSEVRDLGLLPGLLGEFDGRVTGMCTAMKWQRTGGLRQACKKCQTGPPEVGGGGSAGGALNDQLRRYLQRLPRPARVDELADHFDCAPLKIRGALRELRDAGYEVDIDVEEATAAIHIDSAGSAACGTLPGWGEHVVRFCAISDTHCESRCCAWDELHAVYDRCDAEGVRDVLHAGNLSDGPGERGYRGHYLEVSEGCHQVYDCLRYLHQRYPRREGVKTHFISSSTCHEGWEFKATGLNMGHALAHGCRYKVLGPDGEDVVSIPPRDDLNYLGMDEYDIHCGPEENTRIRLFHPGGGSAYALSYKSQKYVESLQGGTKPHLAIIGHFHKSSYFTPRDVRVLQPGCLEWQTSFMRKHMIDAHVAAWFVTLHVDGDGSIRRVIPEEMPFYFDPQRYYYLGGSDSDA